MKRLIERDIYDTLRDKCGLTHYMVEVIVKEYMDSKRFRTVLSKEKSKFLGELDNEIEQLAVQCQNSEPRYMVKSLLRVIWENRNEAPAVCYTIARAVASRVAGWYEWDNLQRANVSSALRPLKNWEQKKAKNQWTEQMLHTYLIVNNMITPRGL